MKLLRRIWVMDLVQVIVTAVTITQTPASPHWSMSKGSWRLG